MISPASPPRPPGASSHASPPLVYKICSRASWVAAEARGVVEPSADDQRDGYVHLSAPQQVRGSLERHFAGRGGLVLLAVRVDRLPAQSLVWEPSRGNELFPHLYGVLPTAAVASACELELGDDGRHRLPEGL